MRLRHSLTALAAGSRLALAEDSCTSADLTIRTTSGTYTGFVDPARPNVNQWLGIQFGAPPVGADRFMPPKPAPYSGSRDATSYKPICFQQSTIGQGVFWQLVPEFQNVDPQSEDCLYLNIWGPRKPVDAALVPAEKVPVIIWVCGGGFREGGGHAPYQVPDQWIQRTQTHIVITFNYRLNVFGFPGAEAAPYNIGLLDIRLV
jgi:carboxylesterase type B